MDTQLTQYRDTALAALAQVPDLLDPAGQEALRAVADGAALSWRTRQIWRTETEARCSVLGLVKQPTPQARYWQSVREQAVFTDNLVHLSYDYRLALAKCDELRAQALMLRRELDNRTAPEERLGIDAQARQAEVEAERQAYIAQDMRLQAADRVREIAMWETLKAEALAEAKRAGTPIDTTDPGAGQLETLRLRAEREAIIARTLAEHGGGDTASLINITSLRESTDALATSERLTAGEAESTGKG